MTSETKVQNGAYLVYVKDEVMYPIVIDIVQWEQLQEVVSLLTDGNITILNSPMGKAMKLANAQNDLGGMN